MRLWRTGSTYSRCLDCCGRSSPGAKLGLIPFVQTFGDWVNFNPRVLAADGAFLPDGRFVALPAVAQALLAEGFRRAVLDFLVLNDARSVDLRERMLAWRHAGLSARNEVSVASEDAEGRKKLAGYMLRAPMFLEKVTYCARGMFTVMFVFCDVSGMI